MATLILAAAVLVLAAVVVWQNRHRLATRRHQTAPTAFVEECEVCGARNPDNVTVGAVTARPDGGGWSGITATWCLEHCPEEHRPLSRLLTAPRRLRYDHASSTPRI